MDKYQYKTDEELVEIIRDLNKELYLLIVKRYESKLIRYVNYLINNDSKSADAVQETFIKAFVNLNSFNTKKKFSSWIYRIAHNEAMNIIKKNRMEISIDLKQNLFDSQDVEEDYSKSEIIKMARKCLDKIPFIYSEPLSLYYLEDKSYDDISTILRINIGTVGTRINRAKSLMKKICQKIN